jgi:uncharacterized membrane protein
MVNKYIKILILLLLIDIPVIALINNQMYSNMFKNINNDLMIFNNNKLLAAIIAYLLLAYAIYYFIIKNNLTKNDAFLLGIIIYGIYNATNYFTINKYSIEVAIKDTIWGGLLFFLVTNFYFKKIF